MAGVLHELSQQRFIGEAGGVVGAQIIFYLSGTTDLANIYSDINLTSPLANPVEVAAGEILPDIYLDPAITYRRRIVYTDGTVDDLDPYQSFATILFEQELAQGNVYLTSFAGGIADGTTSNVAALEAAIVAAQGKTLIIPPAEDDYILDTDEIALGGLHLIIRSGASIKYTGPAVSSGYKSVFEVGDNTSITRESGSVIYQDNEDWERYAFIGRGVDTVIINDGEDALIRNMNRSMWTATTEVYDDVVTSGAGKNCSDNIHITGGRVEFDTPAVTDAGRGADTFLYTKGKGWSCKNFRYKNTKHGLQWWGGDSKLTTGGNGAVTNERKCGPGDVSGGYVDTVAGGGIWGSMGENIEISDSGGREAGDVGLDCEGSFGVRFNDCYWRNAHNGCLGIFFFNRSLEFNNCKISQDDADNPMIFFSNPSQSTDNRDVTITDLEAVCNDTSQLGYTVQAAVGTLKIEGGSFRNCTLDTAALNNNITEISGVSVYLTTGATRSASFTVDTTSDTVSTTLRNVPPFARVALTSTGTLPSGCSAEMYTFYDSNGLLKLASSLGLAAAGTGANFTDTGTGVHTIRIALDAIKTGGHVRNGGYDGRAILENNTVIVTASMPSEARAFSSYQYDPGGSPLTVYKNNISPVLGILAVWGGQNGSTSGVFVHAGNLTDNNFSSVQSNAAAAGTFLYDNNRNTANVLFGRTAKINDPSGGATIDAEARTAINALIDAIEAQGIAAA